ncbi:GntR family transcriptional regulator, partial [Streptomyces rubiginosohelvolus]|uniref:GntR family transcriptional regulator n=1 Tax=Streptomyces rubiginosohelvolus TaxID=67362 RepID=UPI00167ADBBA
SFRARIASGDLQPGDKLPSTKNLAAEFGASELLVYRAITQLKESGHVVARQGAGAFVRVYNPLLWNPGEYERGERADDPVTNTDDWKAQVRAQGREPEQGVPQVSTEPAPKNIAAWLGLEAGTPVVARRRLRLVDGEPCQLADSWFPMHIAEARAPGESEDHTPPLMAERDVTMKGGILAATGNPQHRIRDELDIRMPTSAEIERLQLQNLPGTPVCQHARIGYGADGAPVRVMVTIAPGDRNRIIYELEIDR